MYNLSSYKEVLKSLNAIDKKVLSSQKFFFRSGLACFFVSLSTIVYFLITKKLDVGEGVKVSLIPIFNFLFASYYKNILETKKIELTDSLINHLESGELKDKVLDLEDLKSILSEKLNKQI